MTRTAAKPLRRGVATVALASVLLLAGCTASVGDYAHHSPTPAAPSSSQEGTPSPKPSRPSPSPTETVDVNAVAFDNRMQRGAEAIVGSDEDGYLGSATLDEVKAGLAHYCQTGKHKIPAGIASGRESTYRGVVQTIGAYQCGTQAQSRPQYTPTAEDMERKRAKTRGVLYELEGEGAMSVTVQMPTGVAQTESYQFLKDSEGRFGVRAGQVGFAYISGQNGADGAITCRIHRDGVLVSENTSHGKHSIVTCSG